MRKLLTKRDVILETRSTIFSTIALVALLGLPTPASAQGFLGAVMSLQQGDNVCNPPPTTSAFQTTDAAAHAWFAVSSAQSSDSASIQFFNPNGVLHSQFNYKPPISPGHTCFIDASLPIAGQMTGTWTTKIIYNQVTLTTLFFTISAPGSLSITTSSLANGVVGQRYSQTVSVSGGTPPYTFSAAGLPPRLTISPTASNLGPGGIISGIPASPGASMVTVTVQDGKNNQVSQQFSLTINTANQNQGLSITTTSLASGGTGQMYSQSVAATGGTPPYTFSATGLPPGLNISAAGNITGTPTTNGSYPVVITVTDATNSQTAQNYTLLITSSLTIATPAIANGSVGQSYFQAISAVGGTIPFTFTATGLPPGLLLTSVGNISGTPAPSSAGTYTVDVTVTDSKKVSATAEYTLIIYSPPAISTASPLPDAAGGVAYSQTFSATGGLAPYRFFLLSGPSSVTVSTAGVLNATFLAGGPVTFTVQVIDANNNASTKAFTLNVNVPLQQVIVTPLSIQFTAPFGGGELPHSQNVALTGGAAGSVYQLQVDDGNGGAAPAWLKVTPLSGAVPGVFHVGLVATPLPGGTYMARVRIIIVTGTITAPAIDVAVTLTLAAGMPNLSASPGSMRFSRRNPEQALVIHNAGSGGPQNFTATITGGNSFISSVTPSSGQTPAVLSLRVNASTPGASRGSLHIASAAGNVDIPVSLFVPSPGPALAIAQTGFRFQTIQGSGTSTTQTIRIMNVGDSGTTVNWIAELVAGSDWLSLDSTSGTATPTIPGNLVLKTGPGVAAEAAGGHYAFVRISASGAQNSPQYAVGVLDVAVPGAPTAPDPTKGGLFFAGVASGIQPGPQLLDVGVSSAAPVKVAAAASTSDGGKWLSLTTLNDLASSAQTAEYAVSVNTAGLKPAIYTAEIDIAIGNQVRVVNVTLAVAPADTTLSTSASLTNQTANQTGNKTREATNGCVASQLALTETGIVSNFSVPASWPATLEMQLNDDCGSPVINGTVVASFSNGDAPITLQGDGQTAFYSATWQPGNPSASISVTLDAAAPGLPAASTQLAGGVNANSTPAPSLVINGLLHNVNAIVGAPLAPGTVSQVYGTNLASSPDGPTSVPLPFLFKGVQVLVGGLNAPLYYISPTQLTVQIPSELPATNEYQALIAVNGAYTLPQPVDLVPVAPGVVAFPDGSLVAQHSSDFSLVSAAKPAKPGEVLIIYLVGLGATSVNVPSGTPAPRNQLVVASTPVTVTIDSQQALTPFVGLTPGGVGLYQINLIVPPNAKAGKLPVTIIQAGIAANATTLLVQP